MKKRLNLVVLSGVIAATYVALTYISAMLGLAYGPVQFRLSEALCVLSAFNPAAVFGLTIGCVISNLGSSLGPIDMLCGSCATLIASALGYLFRRFKIVGVPWIAIVSCIISNAVIVGAELALILTPNEAFLPSFAINAFFVAVGEIAVCVIAGVPLALVIERNNKVKELIVYKK